MITVVKAVNPPPVSLHNTSTNNQPSHVLFNQAIIGRSGKDERIGSHVPF